MSLSYTPPPPPLWPLAPPCLQTVAVLLMNTALPRARPVRRGDTNTLLPSVIEKLSQRSCDVFTLTADLCSRERAMSRRIVSNLNTTLQWSWLWPMYGASVYPAPVSLTGPRRSGALALSGGAGSKLGQCLMEDQQPLNHPHVWQRIPGMD